MRIPEGKQKAIGYAFIRVFDEAATWVRDADFLAQGTIYPDRVESAATSGLASRIKSHHNVGALPDDVKLRLIDPVQDLYKGEVRAVVEEELRTDGLYDKTWQTFAIGR